MSVAQSSPAETAMPRLAAIAGALLFGCAAMFGLAYIVADRMATREAADGETRMFLLMQQTADAMSLQTRALLSTFDEMNRLTALTVTMDERGDPVGRAAALAELNAAMGQNRLRPLALQVRNAAGQPILTVGDAREGPIADADSNGRPVRLSRPWRNPDGTLAEDDVTGLADRPGWTVRVTFDPTALSRANAAVLPPNLTGQAPTILSLIRLDDGSVASRSDGPGLSLESLPRIHEQALAFERDNERGVRRGVSALSGRDTLVAFRRMDDLGLAAVVTAGSAEMLASSELLLLPYRRMPWVVLVASLVGSGALLLLLARRRGKAALQSQHQRAEAASAARGELEHLVNCSPAMLYRGKLDPQGGYTRDFVTPNSKAITGWEPEMLSDPERVWKLSAEEDRHLRGTNYARALREGRSAVEYRFLRPDGGFSWLRNEAVITRRNADGSAEVAGAVTNVTREREMAAFAAMQNRMATLGQIATSLAHELTQPMTVIAMAAAIGQSVADEVAVPHELHKQLAAILIQTDRAGELIRHLRSYGHVEGGGVAPVILKDAVRGALTLAATPLREANVAVSVELPDGLPAVQARLVQVEQVLVNLLMNARDAMLVVPTGERRLRIWATPGAVVRLHVADSGPGVGADVIPRMFEAFYTTKPPGEGTGLGLALCQTMMRGFGGAITVGPAGRGAEFILEFVPCPIDAVLGGTHMAAASDQALRSAPVMARALRS